nr:PhM00085.1 [Neoporphyra haitanensis]WOE55320.1 PhF00083.1 [Neoporphyra haitanensis]
MNFRREWFATGPAASKPASARGREEGKQGEPSPAATIAAHEASPGQGTAPAAAGGGDASAQPPPLERGKRVAMASGGGGRTDA